MLNIKYCKKCKRAFDFEECPYCKRQNVYTDERRCEKE